MADNSELPEGFTIQGMADQLVGDGKEPKAGDLGYTSGEAKPDPLGNAVIDTVAGGVGGALGRMATKDAGAVVGNEIGSIGTNVKATLYRPLQTLENPGAIQRIEYTHEIPAAAAPEAKMAIVNKAVDEGKIRTIDAQRALNFYRQQSGRKPMAEGGMAELPAGFSLEQENQPQVVNQAPGQTATPSELPPGFELQEDKYGTPGQQAIAGLEGAAQGVAGPLAPMAERALGVKPEDIRGREEENPATHMAGEAAGLIGSTVALPGLGAGLSKAGEALNAAVHIGEGTAAKIGSSAFKAAAENVLYQGQDEISKLVKQDPNQSAQTAMANIGLAAVIGGGAGAVFGAVPELWKLTEGTKAGQMVADFASRMKYHVSGATPSEVAAEELMTHRVGVANAANAAEDTVAAGEHPKILKVNKILRDAEAEFAPAREALDKHFASEGPEGKPIIDEAKVAAHFSGENKESTKALSEYLEKSADYKKEVLKAHDILGLPTPELSTPVSAILGASGKETIGAKLADYFVKHGATSMTGEGMAGLVGGLAGHSTGIPHAGVIGAYLGKNLLGPTFSSVLSSIAEPLVKGVTSASGAKAAFEYAAAVAKGETSLNKAAAHVFRAGTMELPKAMTAPSTSDTEKLNRKLQGLQTNENGMLKVGGEVGHYLPEHATSVATTAQQAANYLNSLRPNTQPKAPLDTRGPPSTTQQANYNRALAIAEKPLSVLGKIKDGRLTATDVATMQHLYPDLYSRVSQKLINEMTNSMAKGEVIPYRTRIALSRFLAQPLDSTLTPQGILGAQPKPEAAQGQPETPTQPGSRPKRSMASLSKVASQNETQLQARQSRANKQ